MCLDQVFQTRPIIYYLDDLVKCLSNIESLCKLKDLGFESDYVVLHKEARKAMTVLQDEENFSPQKLVEMEDETDTNKYKAPIPDQRKRTKVGFERVKLQAQDIRQECEWYVTTGTS